MRHPLTAAIPAVLLVLAACGDNSLTGPSTQPLKDMPISLPVGSSTTPSGDASGAVANPTGDPALNAAGESGDVANGGGRSGDAGTSGSQGGTNGSNGAGAVGSNGGAGSLGSGSEGAGSTDAGSSNGGSTGSNAGGSVSSSVEIGGSFEVVIPGLGDVVGFRTSPYPAAAGGECGRDQGTDLPNGTWIKTTNGTTSTHPLHVHCLITTAAAPITITVTVADRATYVQAPSGNLALNLPSSCPVGISDPSCADRFVHFNANGDVTSGSGHLTGTGSDGSVWTIDLSQISHSGNWRSAPGDGISPTYRNYGMLVATSSTGLTANAASFSW